MTTKTILTKLGDGRAMLQTARGTRLILLDEIKHWTTSRKGNAKLTFTDGDFEFLECSVAEWEAALKT